MKDSSKKVALLRILQILKKYSSKEKPLTQEAIIDKLMDVYSIEVERKAVGRYLQDLSDAGFNIKNEPRRGSYIDEGIPEGYLSTESFPGFDFRDDELFFLLAGISGSTDIGKDEAEKLAKKIANMGNESFRQSAKRLIHRGHDQNSTYHAASENMKFLNKAIDGRKEVRFKYHSYKLNKKTFSDYEIIRDEDLYDEICRFPLDISFAGGRAFLIGKDPGSDRLEAYRLDRMSKLAETGNRFAEPTSDEKDRLDNFKMSHPFMQGGNTIQITLRVAPDLLPDVADSFGSEIKYEGKTGSSLQISVIASEDDMVSWAMKNAGKAEVLKPYPLRNTIYETICKAQKKYVPLDRVVPSEREHIGRSFPARLTVKDRLVDNSDHQLDKKNYRTVYLENNNISNVNFLQYYDDLKDLTIINNPVLNFRLHANCNLKKLELSKTGMERINFIKNLSKLEELILFDDPIEDYSFLYGLRGLKKLMIDSRSAKKIDLGIVKNNNPGLLVLVEDKHWHEKLRLLTIPDPFGLNKWQTEEQIREKNETKGKIKEFYDSLSEEQAEIFKYERIESEIRNISLKHHPLKTLSFGEYPQDHAEGSKKEPIEWIVLEDGGDDLLLISKKALASGRICSKTDNDPLSWGSSDLRGWLNTEFYNSAFSKKERASIIETEIVTAAEQESGAHDEIKTTDRIYLLSKEEYERCHHLYDVRNCELTVRAEAGCPRDLDADGVDLYKPYRCEWWLRSSLGGSFCIGGSRYEDESVSAFEDTVGVRPVMRVRKTPDLSGRIRDVLPSADVTPDSFRFEDHLERRYLRGKALLDVGAYGKASKYFYLLDYKDSNGLFKKARELEHVTSYSNAEDLIADGNYDQGYKLLKELGYDAVVIENKYRRALDQIEEGDKSGACRLLCDLHFKNADGLLRDCERDALAEAKPGDSVVFGSFSSESSPENSDDQQPIEWTVLAKEGKKLLLVTSDPIDAKPFNETEGDSVTWKNCSLRKWLNETFYNKAFSSFEQSLIERVRIVTAPYKKTEGEEDVTLDRIFLLSGEEYGQYSGGAAGASGLAGAAGSAGAAVAAGASKRGAKAPRQFCWLRNTDPHTGRVLSSDEFGHVSPAIENVTGPSGLICPAMWVRSTDPAGRDRSGTRAGK